MIYSSIESSIVFSWMLMLSIKVNAKIIVFFPWASMVNALDECCLSALTATVANVIYRKGSLETHSCQGAMCPTLHSESTAPSVESNLIMLSSRINSCLLCTLATQASLNGERTNRVIDWQLHSSPFLSSHVRLQLKSSLWFVLEIWYNESSCKPLAALEQLNTHIQI